MNRALLISVFSSLLIVGCSLTNSNKESIDEKLKERLIGSWDFGYYSAQYLPNNTFVDSFYTGQNLDELEFIIVGDYSIENEILFRTNIKIEHFDSTQYSEGLRAHRITFFPSKMEIIDSTLKFTGAEVLNPENEFKAAVSGNWTSELSVTGIERAPNWETLSGIVENRYSFNPDSMTFYSEEEDFTKIQHSVFSDSGSYTYEEGYLELHSYQGAFYRPGKVVFENDKFYWIFEDWYSKTRDASPNIRVLEAGIAIEKFYE